MTKKAATRRPQAVARHNDWIGTRERQEDARDAIPFQFPSGELARFCVLCDGMGGHVGGQIASRAAVAAACQSIAASDKPEARTRLLDALTAANFDIGALIRDDPKLAGMGATFVGVIARPGKLHWISVGDSPMWLFRNDRLTRLNDDHSLRSQLESRAARGEITYEEAQTHPNRNALVSAVMGEKLELYDLNEIDIQADDRIIIASDGIETLSLGEITDRTRRHRSAPPEDLVNSLIDAVKAHRKPNQDNTSVIVLDSSRRSVGKSPKEPARASGDLLPYLGGGLAAILALIALLFVLLTGGEEPEMVREPIAALGRETATCTLSEADQTAPGNVFEFCECLRENPDAAALNIGVFDQDSMEIFEHCKANGGALPVLTEEERGPEEGQTTPNFPPVTVAPQPPEEFELPTASPLPEVKPEPAAEDDAASDRPKPQAAAPDGIDGPAEGEREAAPPALPKEGTATDTPEDSGDGQ